MGLEFLSRVRRASFWVGTIAALVVATYGEPLRGLAVGLGTLSLANWACSESDRGLTGRDRRAAPATGARSRRSAGPPAVRGGMVLLRRFRRCCSGRVLTPFGTAAQSGLRLPPPSRAWSRFVRSPAGGCGRGVTAGAWRSPTSGPTIRTAQRCAGRGLRPPMGRPHTARATPAENEEAPESSPTSSPC
jgi:hypothetical protein